MKDRALRYVTHRPKSGGGLRHYWQRPGQPLIRLPDEFEAMRAEAKRLNDRADREAEAPAPPSLPTEGSWGHLVSSYRTGERFTGLAKATREGYRLWLDAMACWHDYPISTVDRLAAMGWLDGIKQLPSRRIARAVLMALYGHALDRGWIDHNPILGLRMAVPKARDRYVLPDEFQRLREAAREAGAPDWFDVGLHLYLFTAQRRGDGLLLPWPKQGLIHLRQTKTRQLVAIPVHRDLAAVLATFPRRGVSIMIDEHGKPVSSQMMGRLYRKVRQAAGLDDLQIRDFRRTAVVRMAEAGCTVPQIASITGHTIQRTQQIIDTYFVATEATARAAIDRWEQHQPGPESNDGALTGPEKSNQPS